MSVNKKDRMIKALYVGVFLLFSLLIYKEPFSQRTLIPNFEPYPDTFNYINPALNLVAGMGFNIGRGGRVIQSHVPPLYSISLLPVFMFKSDSRMSYYSNVILAFISLLLFWSILRKIIANKFILFFLLILYITNYFIYWVPSVIMAENLTLTLYLAGVYFLLVKTTKINAFMLGLFAVGSYATKYANIAVTLSLAFIFFGKTIFGDLMTNQKVQQLLFFTLSMTLFFLLLGIFEALFQSTNIFTQIFEQLFSIFKSIPSVAIQGNAVSAGSTWFGVQYVSKNFPQYISSLMGAPNRFLWDQTPLVPRLVAIFGLIGLFSALMLKKIRYLAFSLLLILSTIIIFLSSFYSFDARYIYIAIPSLLIGLGLFLEILEVKILRKPIFSFLVCTLIFIYLVSSFTRIKSQIGLNLRHAETPWNYIAILKMNEYFTSDKVRNNPKPILISALPPFLIDYYSNGNYMLLPLSYEQEFRGQEVRQIIWGPNDYSDLPKLYKKYLVEGFDVYVSRAGLGNEGYTNRDFNIIVNEFDTNLVLSGCFDQCNIYRLALKQEKGK